MLFADIRNDVAFCKIFGNAQELSPHVSQRYVIPSFIWAFLWMAQMAYGQANLLEKTNLDCTNCTPQEALVKLSKQTGINIVFSEAFFANCPRRDYVLRDLPFLRAVEDIDRCAKVDYKIIEGQVAFFKKNNFFNLNGYVSDAETGERLLGANVRVLSKVGIGTASNDFGFFSLRLEEGQHLISFSFIGYMPDTLSVDLTRNATYNIRLRPNTQLGEVLVLNRDVRGLQYPAGESPRELSLADVRAMPSPGGEPDVLRFAALQAGVQTGVDGLGGLTVRGGNTDQNLFLLDDVPVYSPSHALGLFSIFNPATISSAKLWKGDFPARYGSRASSVLDVRTRDGNMKTYHAEASAGLFAASGTLEGPIRREKSSFLLSGRTTYFDPWINLLDKQKNLFNYTGDQISYRFYDANLKANYLFSNKNRLYLSLYTGGDGFGNSYEQRFVSQVDFSTDVERSAIKSRWGNSIAALRWNSLLRKDLFTNTTLRFSSFFYSSSLTFDSRSIAPGGKERINSNFAQIYQTLIKDFSAKTDFSYYVSDKSVLRWGAAFTRHDFQPGALSANFRQATVSSENLDSLVSILLNNERLGADESEAYIDTEFAPFRNWRVESGLNASIFVSKDVRYQYFQPRFRVQRSGKNGWSQWIGVHRAVQTLHQVGTYNVSLPFELWVPSTKRVKPEEVWQYSAGIEWKNRAWGLQLKGYRKDFGRVLTFVSNADALALGGAEDAAGWEDRIIEGVGQSKGVEFVLEKFGEKTSGQLAYTRSRTTRQFDDLNSGREFPFRFDRLHDLKITARQRIFPWLEASAIWAFATGNPITLTGVKYRHESVEGETEREVFVYTDVNGYRLPNYHRLDLALNVKYATGRFRHEAQIGAYNAYNRANPFFLFVDASSGVKGRAIQYTLLPFLPSLRYALKF
jgi:hypothetical protein